MTLEWQNAEYKFLLSFPGKIRVEVLQPIETKGLEAEDVTDLTERCFCIMRETFFRLSGTTSEANGSAQAPESSVPK